MTTIRRLTAVVVALLCATVVLAGPATATPTATARPTKVALLVQYPDKTVKKFCVPYVAGMSGADVLAPAHPTYGSGVYAGFVVKIGGQGTVPPTTSTYWAYWRSPNGRASGYAYSDTGVTSTRPAAGSVEAWIWYPGHVKAFDHRSYTALCPNGHT